MTTARSGFRQVGLVALLLGMVAGLAACGGATDDGLNGGGGKGGSGKSGASGKGGGSGGSAGGCDYEGKHYRPNESFPSSDGCNTCSCSKDGAVACTLRGCVEGCVHNGQNYLPGEIFPAGDGCNTCSCEANGQTICTRSACRLTCEYNGQKYELGQSFPANDGCNTCQCMEGGQVACTERACPCEPAKEWWRQYVATDPGKCAIIDYGCPQNTLGFENQCGCGCEQDRSCPEWIDCMPPNNCSELTKKCPFSKIAL